MNAIMHLSDWAILAVGTLALLVIAGRTQKYMRSVSDFLAAGRTARRYLLTVTSGAAGHAAVRVIGTFEMVYKAGFTVLWWPLLMPVNTFINVTGFVVYRFRETRALTLAQFLEIRYSKRLRIFAGILMFVSGVLNMGIFPAVGARFFIYFCGLPESVRVAGASVSTLAIVTVALMLIAIYLTLGGQITLLFTEFFEGITTNFAFLLILGFLYWAFDWSSITRTLMAAPHGKSMLDPFQTSDTGDFGVWYFVIAAFTMIYGTMAWQGTQGFNSAPSSPHEARMGKLLGQWRDMAFGMMITLMPIAAYVMMHDPNFSASAHAVQDRLVTIENKQVQTQMLVPIALAQMLPIGLKGILCAIMFYGFLGNLDTYLHSWGSIFVQDVLLPFRTKPFTPTTHIRLLRWSIAAVAVFITLFSLLYEPTEFVLMFQIATGAIYLAGAGAIIIGGLYWSRGTTAGAWAAMICGAAVMFASIAIRQIEARAGVVILKQPNPQIVSLVAMIVSSVAYVVVSLVTCRRPYDLRRMLHRGDDVPLAGAALKVRKPFLQRLGINHDFTRGDKLLGLANVAWALFWFALTWGTTLYCSRHLVSDHAWSTFWEIKSWVAVGIGALVTIWITFGGISDLKFMLHRLRTMERNDLDDGTVVDHRNLNEVAHQKPGESVVEQREEAEKVMAVGR